MSFFDRGHRALGFQTNLLPKKTVVYLKKIGRMRIEINANGLGHIIKMATTLIYEYNAFGYLLQNQWVDFNETWCVASEKQAYFSLFRL